VQVTELLVKHGATVNVSDLWKFTPLHEAAAKGGGRTNLTIYSMLRIRDILVWIRIRGSMPLINGSGSFYFRH
jgi:hypothetical protein